MSLYQAVRSSVTRATLHSALKISLGLALIGCEGGAPPPLMPAPLEDLIGGEEEQSRLSPVSPMLRPPTLSE